ncbi:hypothetical protein GYMLUDRAFT_245805 [Collybiopsis luxurians FD-317 M1]|uniref:Biogenesis of lysosome-related organelles complex 1 subunit CNL1 n=1 Tax=Collybiopsis luxurians FD-317 M1 TaxID=944289 RepID=A0A0D0BTH1_9AGAR|nr:hypothetical protein GYMLUDRAFT_245805 [Collybiopsis luxurians FD-317 M1]
MLTNIKKNSLLLALLPLPHLVISSIHPHTLNSMDPALSNIYQALSQLKNRIIQLQNIVEFDEWMLGDYNAAQVVHNLELILERVEDVKEQLIIALNELLSAIQDAVDQMVED